MTRWSLRWLRRRAPEAVTGTDRLDPGRLESDQPDSYPANGYRPQAFPLGVTGTAGPSPSQSARYASQPATFQGQTVTGYRPLLPADQQPPWFQPYTAHPGQTGATFAQVGAAPTAPPPAAKPSSGAWPETMDQLGLHLLTLAEQMRISLDELEADEADPDRLQRLYKVDHAVARMRRTSRDLRILAGRADDEIGGSDTSVLDVIRVAMSAIEHYTQVTVGRVTDFAVIGYAADDVAGLLAALLDNATKYSPGSVSVSAHLADGGSVLLRVEDTGIGIPEESVEALNAVFAGAVPDLDERAGRHTGFPVVHRIARKYAIGVRLAARPKPGSGTIVTVTVPPQLLCELPVDPISRPEPPMPSRAPARVAELPAARRGSLSEVTDPPGADVGVVDAEPEPGDQDPDPTSDTDDAAPETGALPRRESVSLRGEQGPLGPTEAPERTPQEQSAARYSFADDLTAFSLGSRDSAEKGTSS